MTGSQFFGSILMVLSLLSVVFAAIANASGVPMHGLTSVLGGFVAMVMGFVGLIVNISNKI